MKGYRVDANGHTALALAIELEKRELAFEMMEWGVDLEDVVCFAHVEDVVDRTMEERSVHRIVSRTERQEEIERVILEGEESERVPLWAREYRDGVLARRQVWGEGGSVCATRVLKVRYDTPIDSCANVR